MKASDGELPPKTLRQQRWVARLEQEVSPKEARRMFPSSSSLSVSRGNKRQIAVTWLLRVRRWLVWTDQPRSTALVSSWNGCWWVLPVPDCSPWSEFTAFGLREKGRHLPLGLPQRWIDWRTASPSDYWANWPKIAFSWIRWLGDCFTQPITRQNLLSIVFVYTEVYWPNAWTYWAVALISLNLSYKS